MRKQQEHLGGQKAIEGSNKGQDREIYFNETNVITFRLKVKLLVYQIIDVAPT